MFDTSTPRALDGCCFFQIDHGTLVPVVNRGRAHFCSTPSPDYTGCSHTRQHGTRRPSERDVRRVA